MKLSLSKVIILILLLILCGFIYKSFMFNGVEEFNDIFTNGKALENTNNLIQIITALFVVIGVFIAVWQFVLSVRSEMSKYQNERIQKAIDLSEYYKNEILDNMVILYQVYKKTNILDILETIKIKDMEHFNCKELEENLSQSQINELTKLLKSPKLIEVLIKVNETYCFNKKPIKSVSSEELKVDVNQIYDEFINGIVSKTLNNLEFFAMHFTHHTADESVVYQSLHIAYLEVIQMLYYDIAINNKSADKMLYTNIIELFNIWKEQSLGQSDMEQKSVRKRIIKGKLATSVKFN